MSVINVLPKQIAELIAAGEVVERPASAIKELVENSIDSGATRITVDIEHGGILKMSVTDNGCGIAYEDVPTAFLRHATSKISSEDDLNCIGTLGFRGEALAAISTVSRVSMYTRMSGCELGTHYVIEGGEEKLYEETGCPEGTVIEVRDLFYNTPARMKFLKKDIKEGANIAAVIDCMALSHPEIAFKLIRDGKQVMSTQGNGKLYDAAYAVLGKDIASGLIPVKYEYNGVLLSGYICKPFKCRPNRNLQMVFLNGRFVKSKTAMAALDVGYKNSAMVGKFPYCILNIDLPLTAVDVNVHPAKTEVRFADESRIFDCIRYGVANALKEDTSRPDINVAKEKVRIRMTTDEFLKEMGGEKPSATSDTTGETVKLPITKTTFRTENEVSEIIKKVDNGEMRNIRFNMSHSTYNPFSDTDSVPDMGNAVYSREKPFMEPSDTKPQPPKAQEDSQKNSEIREENPKISDTPEPRYVGEVFKTYIIAECEDRLYLVDKHATHERILFEKLKRETEVQSQQLLTLNVITLQKREYAEIISNLDKLSASGFDIDDYGDGAVAVRAVPAILGNDDIPSLLSEIAENLSKTNTASVSKIDDILHSVACKAATKAGYVSSEAELKVLLREALLNPDIRYCPHGRPVAVELTRRELEKMFGRLG